MKKRFTFLLLAVSSIAFGQDSISYKSYRSAWSIIPRFGIGDKQTSYRFKTYANVGLRREFSLGKLLSLNATAGYSLFNHSDLNSAEAGAGVTIYPYYVVSNIFGSSYRNQNAIKDSYYLDVDLEFNINNSPNGNPNIRYEANIGRYNLSNMLFISPKLGCYTLLSAEPLLGTSRPNIYNFYYLGVALGLNPKKK